MIKVYIAGPMRGKPLYNFPAFDAAAAHFRERGWEVINPAEMDRERGFKEDLDIPSADFLRNAILSDLVAITGCTGIVMLPGWEMSQGANVELALAKFLNLDIYYHVGDAK